jgi:hypothetical protein
LTDNADGRICDWFSFAERVTIFISLVQITFMKKSLVIFLLILSVPGFCQQVKLVEGDLSALKDQSSIGQDFTYENMMIGNGEITESEYIKKKKDEFNTKEAGRGDRWEKEWVADRKQRFEPKFIELFEKYSRLKTDNRAKYTLIFNTTRTEPGWVGVGIIRKNARIDGEAFIVETANRKNVIAKLTVTNAPGWGGMGYDYDTGLRIQEAYAKSGKELGARIRKK